jgi:hypothetical protein
MKSPMDVACMGSKSKMLRQDVAVERRSHFCKIRSLHGGDYKECRLLGRYAVWLLLFLCSMLPLLVTTNVVASSPILVTLMIEAILSCQTSVVTKTHTA